MHHTHQLFSYNDQIIEFTIAGEGEPILVFHGGHSNCFEEFGYDRLIEEGFSIITPSRAGYGKTTKAIGTSLATACHYYAKLLEHFRVDNVHVLAISAGGPTGIQFASQFPDNVQTLTLQSAVTKEWLARKDATYRIASILFHPSIEKFTWALTSAFSRLFPRLIYQQMAPSFSTLSTKEVMERTTQEDIRSICEMICRQRAHHGFIIDLSQTSTLPVEQLRNVSCPTLIMHSEHDGSVPCIHVEHAQKNISSTDVRMIDSWGHLIWLSETAGVVAQTVSGFMNAHQT